MKKIEKIGWIGMDVELERLFRTKNDGLAIKNPNILHPS